MSTKEKIIGLIGICSLSLLFYISNHNAKIKEESIKNNNYETVGKVYEVSGNRSFTHAYYYYYYNGLRYNSFQSIKLLNKNYVNKFYKINVSTANPNYAVIFFDQEIINFNTIKNSGFTEKEIINN
jgi:hypothetical protein